MRPQSSESIVFKLFRSSTFLCLVFCSIVSHARDLSGYIGQLPVLAESNDKGLLVDFFKAMKKEYTAGKINFEVVPLERSLQNLVAGRSDFHAPLLKDTTRTEEQLGFAYSDETIFEVYFVLYTNRKNKEINLKNLNRFRIETDVAATRFLDPHFKPSSCLECSLKKVNLGRIDGYIFAGLECDTTINKLKLKNIKSQLYQKFEGKIAIPRGAKGKEINAILTGVIAKTKSTGAHQKTLGQILDYYKSWKPME